MLQVRMHSVQGAFLGTPPLPPTFCLCKECNIYELALLIMLDMIFVLRIIAEF